MLRSLKDLEGYTVEATDGAVGRVVNFFLDDELWTVRYLIVETGDFLSTGRQVLISPISFREADWTKRQFPVALTMDKIKASPSVDLDKPVCRQHELDYLRYYGYPYYWGYGGYGAAWGMAGYPGMLAGATWTAPPAEHAEKTSADVHLRSADEVRGYHIQGSDEAIGHVADFIVDDQTWEVRYLVIDTSNWWFGKKVLLAPRWASRVSWEERRVYVDVSRQTIKNSPEWIPDAGGVNREYEKQLYDYHGRPVYWDSADRAGAPPQSTSGSHPA